MTEQEQLIAIAEACGWQWSVPHLNHYGKWHSTPFKGKSFWDSEHSKWAGEPHDVVKDVEVLPDYLHDLNAMQAALLEHICGDKELEVVFLRELNAIIDAYADSEDVTPICEYAMAQICAPCWALARAFLKTFDKYED